MTSNNYWIRCLIGTLLLLTIIQKRILFVNANSSGAGSCAAGTGSVAGSPHTTALGGLSVAGITLNFGDQVIPGGAGLTLQPGVYSITLNGPFSGVLIRLAPVDGIADTSNTLTVNDATLFRVLDLCTAPSTGVTHNTKDPKTTATFGLDTTTLAGTTVTMDITIVTALASYYFDTYTLTNTAATTTAAPVLAPVTPAPVLAPVTPAPVIGPVTPAPLAVPVTPAPIVPTVPVTPAPIPAIEGVPTRAPSVRAPVAASVRIPVQNEYRTNTRQSNRNPTTNNRNNNNNNSRNNNNNNNRYNNNRNNNKKETNIAAAAQVSDQTYTFDTPTVAPIETTISHKGLLQYLKNFGF